MRSRPARAGSRSARSRRLGPASVLRSRGWWFDGATPDGAGRGLGVRDPGEDGQAEDDPGQDVSEEIPESRVSMPGLPPNPNPRRDRGPFPGEQIVTVFRDLSCYRLLRLIGLSRQAGLRRSR